MTSVEQEGPEKFHITDPPEWFKNSDINRQIDAAYAAGEARALGRVDEAAANVRMFEAIYDWSDDSDDAGWMIGRPGWFKNKDFAQAEATGFCEAITRVAESRKAAATNTERGTA